MKRGILEELKESLWPSGSNTMIVWFRSAPSEISISFRSRNGGLLSKSTRIVKDFRSDAVPSLTLTVATAVPVSPRDGKLRRTNALGGTGPKPPTDMYQGRSEEHTSELQSPYDL